MSRKILLLVATVALSLATGNDTGSSGKTGDPLRDLSAVPPEKRICEAKSFEASQKGYDAGFAFGKAVARRDVENILCDVYPLLDRALKIKTFYIEGILRPPLIGEKKVSMPVEGGMGYVRKGRVYYISEKAKFVPKPLGWRDFLDFDEKTCRWKEKIDVSKFHRPPVERKCPEASEKYEDSFLKGSRDGYRLVMDDYMLRLKRMDSFVDSLSLYHKLYYERKIDPPVIARVESKVEKGKGEISIENSYYRIISRAKFVDRASEWKNFVYVK